MQDKEIFEYDLENGSIMDFTDGRFVLVIKDDFWTKEETDMLAKGFTLTFCYTNGLALFVLEGGDIDSSDFWFNVQACEEAQALFAADPLKIELLLVNADNEICFKREVTCSEKNREVILETLKAQQAIDFMPGEYDVNVEGMQSAYEPFEMKKFAKCELKG